MAAGRISKASRPTKKRVKKSAAATSGGTGQAVCDDAPASKRTVVLDGTFSIKEIEVTGTGRRKAAKTKTKKSAKKSAGTGKQPTGNKKSKKPAVVELGPVTLPSQATIKNVVELKRELTAAHDGDSAVVIDAGKVNSIDTAALQLLVAFADSVRKQSRTIEWRTLSDEFRDMADLADLARHLGIQDAAAEDDDGLCPVF